MTTSPGTPRSRPRLLPSGGPARAGACGLLLLVLALALPCLAASPEGSLLRLEGPSVAPRTRPAAPLAAAGWRALLESALKEKVTRRGMVIGRLDDARVDMDVCVMPRHFKGLLVSLRVAMGADTPR